MSRSSWVLSLLLASGCGPGDAPPAALSCAAAVDSDVSLVVGVDWTPPAAGRSWVEFGETEELGRSTPVVEGDGAVHLDLVALPPDTDVYWRGVTETEAGRSECSGVTRTGAVPGGFPEVTVTTDDGRADPDLLFVGPFFTMAAEGLMLVALRTDGTPVWYHQGEDDTTGLDLHYAQVGGGLLVSQFGQTFAADEGYVLRLSLAGDELERWRVPLAHHMFTDLPDGTLAFQQLDIREVENPETGEMEEWVGDAIGEIAPGETEAQTVFSIWDWITPTWNDHMDFASIYGKLDWTHGNALKYYADRDEYLLSMGHAADVVQIARANHSVTKIWGRDGTLASPPFDYQHDPGWLDDGNLLMFGTDETGSGAIEYEFRDGVPVEVWRHGFEQDSRFLGQARRFPDGTTFVNYGAQARMELVGADGQVMLAFASEPGRNFGQMAVVRDLYTGAW